MLTLEPKITDSKFIVHYDFHKCPVPLKFRLLSCIASISAVNYSPYGRGCINMSHKSCAVKCLATFQEPVMKLYPLPSVSRATAFAESDAGSGGVVMQSSRELELTRIDA